jgi:hypothetical protein
MSAQIDAADPVPGSGVTPVVTPDPAAS